MIERKQHNQNEEMKVTPAENRRAESHGKSLEEGYIERIGMDINAFRIWQEIEDRGCWT